MRSASIGLPQRRNRVPPKLQAVGQSGSESAFRRNQAAELASRIESSDPLRNDAERVRS